MIKYALFGFMASAIVTTTIDQYHQNYGNRICERLDAYTDARDRCQDAAKEQAGENFVLVFLFNWALATSAINAIFEKKQ
jgi:hypothetical protein